MDHQVVGYARVSTQEQDLSSQRYEIMSYASQRGLSITSWVEAKVSSRKAAKERHIETLLDRLREGDTLIVAELSRLGRSVGQIALLANTLVDSGVKLICIKERMRLDGSPDMQTKVMLTMFSLFAEIERDLISERTKAGLMKARAEGKMIGRPRGLGKSALNGKEEEIKALLRKGVTKSSIARMYACSWPCVFHFIKTRKLAAPN